MSNMVLLVYILSVVALHTLLIIRPRASSLPAHTNNAPFVREKRTRIFCCYLGILLFQAYALQALLQRYLPIDTPLPNRSTPFMHTLGGLLLLLIVFAYAEEVIFRVALLRIFQRYSKNVALFALCSALLFGLYHLQCVPLHHQATSCNIPAVIHATLAGVWLAIFHARYRRTGATVALHALYNITLTGVQAWLL